MKKNNGPFFGEGAYQWAENFLKKAPQIPVNIDFEETINLLKNGNYFDQEMFLFESYEKKPPLLMLENVNDATKKSKVLVFPLTENSYKKFKENHFELAQILLMHGRMAYRKEYALGRAELPRFFVHLDQV